MSSFKFKFREPAHGKYGVGWFDLDFDSLQTEVDCGVLETFEDQTGIMVLAELPDLLKRGSYRALRAAMWLTMLVNGHRMKWLAFKADAHTDPRHVDWDLPADAEDEQSSPPA